MSRKFLLRIGAACLLGAWTTATVWIATVGAAQPAATAAPRTPTPRAALDAEERATIDLFEKARRSVVYISPTQRVFDLRTRNPLQVPRGTGSGFFWDSAGHVVTNNH